MFAERNIYCKMLNEISKKQITLKIKEGIKC